MSLEACARSVADRAARDPRVESATGIGNGNGGIEMLRDLSLLVSPVLALLLVVLTPVGTGQGAHRDQLLDPLFPHIHFANGLPTRQSAALLVVQRAMSAAQQGPSFGAGAGAAAAAVSPGLTPPVPVWVTLAPRDSLAWAVVAPEARPTGAFADPPPDPPPNAA
jgi:hypothetical protein